MTEEPTLPLWLDPPSDVETRSALIRLFARSAPECLAPGSARPQLAFLSEILARSISNAAHDEAELDALARVADQFHSGLPTARRKSLFHVLEALLQTLDGSTSVSSGRARAITSLITTTVHDRSKEVIPAIKRLISAGQEGEAADLAEAMLRMSPLSPGYFNTTVLFSDERRRKQIHDSHFERLSKLVDANAAAAQLLAEQLVRINAFERAAAFLEPKLAEGDVRLLPIAANVFFWLDRFGEAETTVERALRSADAFTPKEVDQLHFVLAKCRIVRNDGQGALAVLEACPSWVPNDQSSLHANVCAGRLEQAFSAYWDERTATTLGSLNIRLVSREALEGARVSGKPLAGRAAVTCIMGLGDEARFGSMIQEIAGLFEALTVCCDHRIALAFARSFPDIRFHGSDPRRLAADIDPALASRLDVDAAEIMRAADWVADLKHFAAIFRKDDTSHNRQTCYLSPDRKLVRQWQDWLEASGKVAVGLFWRSNLISHTAGHKKTNLADWLGRIRTDDLFIVPLQYDLAPEERQLLKQDDRVQQLPAWFDVKNDIEQTLGLLAALPLVISLPGTTQHLAGALGTKVLCPTHPYEAAWRRMPGTSHDLWAPSVEIVSGVPERGLNGSIDETLAKLTDWMSSRSRSEPKTD